MIGWSGSTSRPGQWGDAFVAESPVRGLTSEEARIRKAMKALFSVNMESKATLTILRTTYARQITSRRR